jgi:hypothetical protein
LLLKWTLIGLNWRIKENWILFSKIYSTLNHLKLHKVIEL